MNTQTVKIVSITEAAANEIKRLAEADGRPEAGLRLGVKGGGCSGLSYVFDLDTRREKDLAQEEAGFTVFIDPKSSLYLKDLQLDYSGGLKDRGFKFKNPNATSTCGCGESFSV